MKNVKLFSALTIVFVPAIDAFAQFDISAENPRKTNKDDVKVILVILKNYQINN
ncbi:hypothetical protein NsoK4_06475 [Nitrosopumilus sp. K4]|uniref:hypothetical protein n=1 Tax=Nitrosopumilus sp. K4 TaxID=2795383 RepID=UPI001BA4DFC6|nr:hypothetical protein [Nitrosopumilus sp. K4]QUC64090.1 hypothetical protein NsoK4_06475 [Nitrosopumilus sp. K4]